MYAQPRARDAGSVQRHVCVRDLGRRAASAVPRPRPARRQAAVLCPTRRTSSTSRQRSRRCCRPFLSALCAPGGCRLPDVSLGAGPGHMFDGIDKLPRRAPRGVPRCGDFRIEQYWDMRFDPRTVAERRVGEHGPRRGRRERSQRQMVSDVPLGSFLSGGLDSSAIVAAMNGAALTPLPRTRLASAGGPQRTTSSPTTCDTPGGSAERVRHRLSRAGSSSPRSSTCCPNLVWHMDEPVADPACITTYLICSAARERLTVVLSGMGGDEVFAGYPRHLAARIGRICGCAAPPVRAACDE